MTIGDEDAIEDIGGVSRVTDAHGDGTYCLRSVSPTAVSPGSIIHAHPRRQYGGFGQIVETLPAGFTSSAEDGDTSLITVHESYTVTRRRRTGELHFLWRPAETAEEEQLYGHWRQHRSNGQAGRAAAPAARRPRRRPRRPPPPPTPPDQQGMVSLSGPDMPRVGAALTATLSDPDGGISGDDLAVVQVR